MNKFPAAEWRDIPAITLKNDFALTAYQFALSFAADLCSVLWFKLLKPIRRR